MKTRASWQGCTGAGCHGDRGPEAKSAARDEAGQGSAATLRISRSILMKAEHVSMREVAGGRRRQPSCTLRHAVDAERQEPGAPPRVNFGGSLSEVPASHDDTTGRRSLVAWDCDAPVPGRRKIEAPAGWLGSRLRTSTPATEDGASPRPASRVVMRHHCFLSSVVPSTHLCWFLSGKRERRRDGKQPNDGALRTDAAAAEIWERLVARRAFIGAYAVG